MAAYRLGIGSLFRDGALFRYFLYASLLSLAVLAIQFNYVVSRLASITAPQTIGGTLLGIATGILLYVGYALVTCPFGAAVHRKILLGESPRDYYATALLRRPQLRFLWASVAVYAVFFVASLVDSLAIYLIYGLNPFDALETSRGYAANPAIAAVTLPLSLVSYLGAALIATRFTFAFPAMAIETPGASLRRSLGETRGATWRLFFVFLLTFAAPLVIGMILYVVVSVAFVMGHPELVRSPERIETAMLYSTPFLILYAVLFVMSMVMVAVTAAAAASAYELRVHRGMRGVADVFS